MVGAPGSPLWTGVAVMLLSLKYLAIEGFGPSAAIRCATFDCGFCAADEVAALPVADVLLAALLLLGEEPQPAKPMATATIAIVAPLRAADRFIRLAPVDRASPPDKFSALPDPA
jgi:hypothetical protein